MCRCPPVECRELVQGLRARRQGSESRKVDGQLKQSAGLPSSAFLPCWAHEGQRCPPWGGPSSCFLDSNTGLVPDAPRNHRPGQSSLSAGALRYRAWAQSWSSAALAARSVLPSNTAGEGGLFAEPWKGEERACLRLCPTMTREP